MKQYDFFNYKLINSILLILFLFLLNTSVFGQDINLIFKNFNEFSPQDSSSLLFRIENINFFKNNEYESDITEGYTLTGGLIKPQMVYYLNSKLRLSIGASMLKYSGQDKLNKSTLLLSAVFKPNRKQTFIFGNINNDHNHGLPEFMVLSEKFYTGNFETGIQYLYKGEKLNMDCWLDWENFIEKHDTIQEKFTVGLALNYFLNKKNSRNILSIPLYISISHKGGEIDKSDKPASTISNIAVGINYRRLINTTAFTSIDFNVLFSVYNDHKKELLPQFNKGNGIYTTLNTNTRIGDFMIGYWHSKNYFSQYGLDIFHSVSSFDTQFYERNRNLLNFKYTYRYKIGKNSTIGGSIEDYLDLTNNRNNMSASVFLVLNTNIFIKKLKK